MAETSDVIFSARRGGRTVTSGGGQQTVFHEDGDGFVIEQQQDVSSIQALNSAESKNYDKSTRWRGDGNQNRVGRIPMLIVAELMKNGIWEDDDALLAWLDNPGNAAWKTRPGKLI